MGMLRAFLPEVLLLLLILPVLPSVMAAVFFEYVDEPEYPGTCLVKENGVRVKDGDTWDLPDCTQAACYGTGQDMYIEYYTCGVKQVPKHCFLSKDKTKSYPFCCGDIFCPPPIPIMERSVSRP